MDKFYDLNVCLTARDRMILTRKCIESIHTHSSHFRKINIYVFDNLSHVTSERLLVFNNLLRENKICYYSYDTNISTFNCFPKTVIFRRWIDMMMLNEEMRLEKSIDINIKQMYLLSDNDMIYGPEWDTYFISALDNVHRYDKNIKYLVKHPGGVPKAIRDKSRKYRIDNIFNRPENFEIMCSNFGGGSGCWVMNNSMLKHLRWNSKDLIKTYNKFKQHDSITWKKLTLEHGNVNYVCGVIPNEPEKNPLIIHMGPVIGSMCNSLNSGKYNKDKNSFEEKEREIISLEDDITKLFFKNKHRGVW